MHYFPLISLRDIASIIDVTLIVTIIGQCETKHMTLLLRNGNVSFEGLDIHNVTSITGSSYQSRCNPNCNIYTLAFITDVILFICTSYLIRRDDYLTLESL